MKKNEVIHVYIPYREDAKPIPKPEGVERWKPVPDSLSPSCAMKISNHGNVRAMTRFVSLTEVLDEVQWIDVELAYPINHTVKAHVTSRVPNNPLASLQMQTMEVAVMVLTAFVGERPSPEHQPRYLDSNPHNACLDNLEWKVGSSMRSAVKGGEQNPNSKLTKQKARQILECYFLHGMNQTKLASQFNVSRATIRRVVIGESWENVFRAFLLTAHGEMSGPRCEKLAAAHDKHFGIER
jgi:hypothetical protein